MFVGIGEREKNKKIPSSKELMVSGETDKDSYNPV